MSIFSAVANWFSSTTDKLASMGPGKSPISTVEAIKEAAPKALLASGVGVISTIPVVVSSVSAAVAATPKVLQSASISILKSVGSSFVKAPIPTTVATLIGAPLVFGAVTKNPKLITDLPKQSFNLGQKLASVPEEHPVGTAVVGGLVGGVLLYEAFKAAKEKFGFGKDKVIETINNVTIPDLQQYKDDSNIIMPDNKTKDLPSTDKTLYSDIPITPETQIAGKAASTAITKRKHYVAKKQVSNQSVRVNIFNQSSLKSTKYLNARVYA